MSRIITVAAAQLGPIQKAEPRSVAVARMVRLLERAQKRGVELVVFPELALTGYTCGDLFHQSRLLRGAVHALRAVMDASQQSFGGLTIVGVPLFHDDQLFNCAAILPNGVMHRAGYKTLWTLTLKLDAT